MDGLCTTVIQQVSAEELSQKLRDLELYFQLRLLLHHLGNYIAGLA